MDRRTALRTTAAAALLGSAGCLTDAQPATNSSDPDENGSTETDSDETTAETTNSEPITDMIESETVGESTFTRTGDCEESGVATIEYANNQAVITGCVEGHNGCAEPIVRSAGDEDGTFRIVIGEADLSDSETLCTQQIVQRGYELTIEYNDPPSAIEVIHDDVGGREIVATAG